MRNISRRDFMRTGAALSVAGFATLLGGCGNTEGASGNAGASAGSAAKAESAASGSGTGSKTLVAFYSAQGHTRAAAQAIADELGADIFEIVPREPYTDDDLDWTQDGSRVNKEHDDESLRDIPLVASAPSNFADYDTVLLGYPIWWAVSAWPTDRFAKDNDFTGKKVITFCTSTSSGLGQSGKLLAEAAGTGDWQDGKRFSSSADEGEIRDWARSL